MCKTPLDIIDVRPRGMALYLRNYNWHFTKKLCVYAISQMKRMNKATGKEEPIEPISKDRVDELLLMYGVKLENNVMYDYVYWANQCKADLFKSSVSDDQHLAMYVKDMVDDSDAPDGMAMCMWYAKMVRSGCPIDWEEMI